MVFLLLLMVVLLLPDSSFVKIIKFAGPVYQFLQAYQADKITHLFCYPGKKRVIFGCDWYFPDIFWPLPNSVVI